MIPTSCIDNFYSDPDSIRDFALSLDYHYPNEKEFYPGMRTKCLSEIDKNFHEFAVKKFLSCFFELPLNTPHYTNSCFQKIYPYNSNHPSTNEGWAHVDNDKPFKTLAAVVYLNKKTCLDSGTMILSPKIGYENYSISYDDGMLSRKLYNKKLSDENINFDSYSKSIQNHNGKFNTTVEFKNVYNRLVAYDGSNWHKQPSFLVPEEYRLTQVFFIDFLEKIPLKKPLFKNLDYS